MFRVEQNHTFLILKSWFLLNRTDTLAQSPFKADSHGTCTRHITTLPAAPGDRGKFQIKQYWIAGFMTLK